MSPRGSFMFVLCWFVCLAANAAAQERFMLDVPGRPGGGSVAVLDGLSLRITGSDGRTFAYRRRPDLDRNTPGGPMLGYHCVAPEQYVLWPAAGSGAMWIGTLRLGTIDWRESRMRVGRVGAAPGAPNVPAPPPVAGLLAPGARVGRAFGPRNLAVGSAGPNRFAVAYIDDDGRVQLFRGAGNDWRHDELPLVERLVAGAPLQLLDDPQSPFPLVYTTNARSEVVEVSGGSRLRSVSRPPGQAFVAGSHLAVVDLGQAAHGFAVDRDGRVWQLDLTAGGHRLVDPRAGQYQAGTAVAAVLNAQIEIFLVNLRGDLVRYVGPGANVLQWAPAEVVASGLVPGAHVAAETILSAGGVPVVHAVTVAADGHARVVHSTAAGWIAAPVRTALFPPGAPVRLVLRGGGYSLMGVRPDGTWVEVYFEGGSWAVQTIAAGFPVGAPVATVYPGPAGFGIDATGTLLASVLTSGAWQTVLLSPGFTFVPQLISRTIEPAPPLAPATVSLENPAGEDLLVRIQDVREPARMTERSIRSRQTITEQFDRDPGTDVTEVYLVPGPLGQPVTEEHRYRLPPRVLYSLAVYADRVTYSYRDSRKVKPKGSLEAFDMKSSVSLGVFTLAPGELLHDGERIDVRRQAESQKNPGAAVWFGAPR